jgi:hypothetical protein
LKERVAQISQVNENNEFGEFAIEFVDCRRNEIEGRLLRTILHRLFLVLKHLENFNLGLFIRDNRTNQTGNKTRK